MGTAAAARVGGGAIGDGEGRSSGGAAEALGNLGCAVAKIVLACDDSLALNRRSLAVLQAHGHECLGSFREFSVCRCENRFDM